MGCCQGHVSPVFRVVNLIPTGSSCCSDPWQDMCLCPFAGWWDMSSPSACPLGCGILNSACASGNPG